MKYTRIFLFVALSFLFSFCTGMKNEKSLIKQGISGRILWMQGNFMPSPDRPQNNEGRSVQRTIYIYEVTKMDQTEGQAPLFSKVNSKLVTKVKTDKKGYFQCKLRSGSYSIFTLEPNGKFFANLFDGKGEISLVNVLPDKVTNYMIQINYEAAF